MTLKPLPRRTLLRGATATLALPWLEAMHTKTAYGADSMPRRLVLYFTANGFVPDRFRCQVTGLESTDFDLSYILEPFAPIRQHCSFIEGVPMNAGYHPKQTAVAHAGGMSTVFTGSYSPPGDMYGGFAGGTSGYPTRESLDHTIASSLQGQTRYPAYYFGVRVEGPSLLHNCFYAGKDQPITPNADPYAIKKDLFGASFDTDLEARARVVAEQTAVVDAVLESAASLRCRLGMTDRARLDAHLEQVHAIEQSLNATVGDNAACRAPQVADGIGVNNFSEFPGIGQAQTDLMTMALTCDLTRVAGLYWTPPISDPVYTWLGQSEGHHTLTHDPSRFQECADVNRWHAEQITAFATQLAQIPEGDGTVLDNTVILWATDCANSEVGDPHDLLNVSFALIGGGERFFKAGRYFKFPGGEQYSHNRLLLSLLHYMGLEQDSFGEPEYCTQGPLTEIHV